MIVRNVLQPHVSEKAILLFDYFNDYEDTMKFLVAVYKDPNDKDDKKFVYSIIKKLMGGWTLFATEQKFNTDPVCILSEYLRKYVNSIVEENEKSTDTSLKTTV